MEAPVAEPAGLWVPEAEGEWFRLLGADMRKRPEGIDWLTVTAGENGRYLAQLERQRNFYPGREIQGQIQAWVVEMDGDRLVQIFDPRSAGEGKPAFQLLTLRIQKKADGDLDNLRLVPLNFRKEYNEQTIRSAGPAGWEGLYREAKARGRSLEERSESLTYYARSRLDPEEIDRALIRVWRGDENEQDFATGRIHLFSASLELREKQNFNLRMFIREEKLKEGSTMRDQVIGKGKWNFLPGEGVLELVFKSVDPEGLKAAPYRLRLLRVEPNLLILVDPLGRLWRLGG